MIKLIKAYFAGFKYDMEVPKAPSIFTLESHDRHFQSLMLYHSYIRSKGIENGIRAAVPIIIIGFIIMSVIFFKHI